jgi:hypothetical protein
MMAATVHSQASIVVDPEVIPRATWGRQVGPRGEPMFRPIRGTWYAAMYKPRVGASIVVPMMSCPSCAGMLFLSHRADTARILGSWMGRIVPVAHSIALTGKVAPDLRCSQPRCGFHRTVYLDKWDRLRPLYCTAYVEGSNPEIKFAYSHATSQKEARFHLGKGNYHVLSVGRAVGFKFDEKKNKLTAD